MFQTTIFPRFTDTDALGHINNTAFAIWFEEARLPIFEIFHPTLEVKSWPLIIARIEIDLLAQTYWAKTLKFVLLSKRSATRLVTYATRLGKKGIK